jgi:hypothetical protein
MNVTMQRIIVLAAGAMMVGALSSRAADRSATDACPPAATLGDKTGWEPGVSTYLARQEGDIITITATGQNRTGGFKVQFAREPVKIFPPKLALYQKRPEGMATQAITPFTVCVTFKATQSVGAVTVRDSKGEHRVPVESAR